SEAPASAPPTSAPPAPSAPSKKPVWKRWWFWAAAVVVLAIGGSALGGGTDSPSGSGGNDEAEGGSSAEESAGIGDAVVDGQFTFTVQSVKCGKESIGSGIFKEEAQGEYCMVNMKVENTGDESQFMDSSSQYMYIGDNQYSTSDDALLALDESENFFLEEINPGNAVE